MTPYVALSRRSTFRALAAESPARRQTRIGSVVFSIALALAAAGCGADDTCDSGFAADQAKSIHVSASCGSASGDGSAAKPFATLAAGVAAAPTGGTVAVGKGSYAESVTLKGGVSLVGSGSKVVAIAPVDGPGVSVSGAGKTLIRGIAVNGARSFGIGSEGTSLELDDVAVSATTTALDGSGGHGVQVVNSPDVLLLGCQLVANAGVGLLVQSALSVQIIDPAFAPSPRTDGASAAIIDPSFSPTSVVADNGAGGIAIIDPAFMPGKTDAATDDAVRITATDIRNNSMFGIAIYGGGVKLDRCAIHGTHKPTGVDFADGIVLAASKRNVVGWLTVDAESVVASNGRAGVLAAAPAKVQIAGELCDNDYGGLWAQGAGLEVSVSAASRLRRNGLVGAAVTGGARLLMEGARVEETQVRDFADPAGGLPDKVADGVGIFKGATAVLNKVTFDRNARAGVIVHAPGKTAQGGLDVIISGGTFTAGQFGIVVNKGSGAAPTAADLKSGNTFDKVTTDVDPAGDLTVRTAVCGSSADAAAGCAPAL